MTPRDYQEQAIASAVKHFQDGCKDAALCILPTGAGKSLVIAHIAARVGGKFLILQPSKEILEQNIAKYRAMGGVASVYSASLGQKDVGLVTFATIGSVVGKRADFGDFKQVIIDECHYVNSEKGMYQFFLNGQRGCICVGLTATPYRLNRIGSVSVLEFLTRTSPAYFKKVIHVTQQKALREAGYLSPIKFKRHHEINLRNVKVKGVEYDEAGLLREMTRVRIDDLIIQEIEMMEQSDGPCLVFVEFIEIIEKIQRKRPDLPCVTGQSRPEERAQLLEKFKSGEIKTLLNVGVLTTGFDHPSLSKLIVAKATRSLSLWYQIVGRGQRIAEGKTQCTVVDVCDNFRLFGDIQELEILEIGGKWRVVTNGKIITNKAIE